MKQLLLFILSVASLLGYGQEDVKQFQFTSMVDFGTFEQTQTSGAINISLPIYQIDRVDFKLPIELKYNLHGNVNLNSEGEQFGDAWNLNIIGTVTRKTRDTHHEFSNVQVGVYDQSNNSIMVNIPMEQYKFRPRLNDEQYYLLNSSSNERNDAERDLFEFNVLGLSGKFFVYKNSGQYKARLLESSDYCSIQVISNSEYIDSFEITDKNGYKYVLDAKSNINKNHYFHIVKGPAIGQTSFPNHKYLEYSVSFGNLNPAANSSGNSGFNGTVYAKEHLGREFWENMNLTKIYDPSNNLLLSITYDSFGKIWADSNYSYTMTGGMRGTNNLIVSNISIENVGTLTFENTAVNNNKKKICEKITVKDLKGSELKRIDFSYQYPNFLIKKRGYYKALLTQVKDFANTSQPLTTALTYKNYAVNTLDYDNLGYITKKHYNREYQGSEHFRADYNSLQKIKYPTGGVTLYSFEANTASFADAYCRLYNIDNQIFEPVTLTNMGSGQYKFYANQNDKIFILNTINNNLKLFRDNNGTLIHVKAINNRIYDNNGMISRFLSTDDNYYDWDRVTIGISGNYVLKYDSSTALFPTVRKMEYTADTDLKKYMYVSGLRIKEIAYFKEDVNSNLLATGTTDNAEKYTLFDYYGGEADTSSGIYRAGYEVRAHPNANPVFYNQISVVNRGIGKQINVYNTNNTIPLFTQVQSILLYDNQNNLLEEKHFSRQNQWYTVFSQIADLNVAIAPYEVQENQTSRSYESGAYIQTASQQNYETTYRQPSSILTEDNLGKTTKSEFNYQPKGNKIVNTQQRNYIDNNLTDQVQNTYDTAGNLAKTEFKTPEMSTYEQTGMLNPHYYNGLLLGYTQIDGTFVTIIYGYNDTHVVAKMINTDPTIYYGSAHSSLRNNIATYSNQNSTNYSEPNLKNALNSLRNTFPNALVTTYTYKPMVGVSSITDENGKETTYEYDTFNRLSVVKDYLGNILKEYQYNFTN